MIYIYYIKYGFSFDACRMYIGLIQVNSKLATKTRHLVLSDSWARATDSRVRTYKDK